MGSYEGIFFKIYVSPSIKYLAQMATADERLKEAEKNIFS